MQEKLLYFWKEDCCVNESTKMKRKSTNRTFHKRFDKTEKSRTMRWHIATKWFTRRFCFAKLDWRRVGKLGAEGSGSVEVSAKREKKVVRCYYDADTWKLRSICASYGPHWHANYPNLHSDEDANDPETWHGSRLLSCLSSRSLYSNV